MNKAVQSAIKQFKNVDILFCSKLILAFVVFASYYANTLVGSDPDFGWHLAASEQIARTGTVPTVDTWSFTMQGYRWIDYEWLTHYIYGTWLHQLPRDFIAFLCALLFAIPLLVWIKRARTLFEIVFVAGVAYFLLPIVGIRPQVLGFFFFFITIEIVELSYKRSRNLLYLLPPLFFLWAQLHGSFAGGLIYLGARIIGTGIDNWKQNKKLSFDKKLIFFTCLSATITLINPYGLSLWKEVAATTSNTNIYYVTEWLPPFILEKWTLPIFISIFIGATIPFLKSLSTSRSIPAALFLILYLLHVRMGPFFYATVIFISQDVLGTYWVFFSSRYFSLKWVRHSTSIIPLITLTTLLYAITAHWNIKNPYQPPTGITKMLASPAFNFDNGNIFNDYETGGTIIGNVPGRKVFIDGRITIWQTTDGFSAMNSYIDIRYHKNSNWQQTFKKFNIRTAILSIDPLTLPEHKIRTNIKFVDQYLTHLEDWISDRTLNDTVTELKNARWCEIYNDSAYVILQTPESKICKQISIRKKLQT